MAEELVRYEGPTPDPQGFRMAVDAMFALVRGERDSLVVKLAALPVPQTADEATTLSLCRAEVGKYKKALEAAAKKARDPFTSAADYIRSEEKALLAPLVLADDQAAKKLVEYENARRAREAAEKAARDAREKEEARVLAAVREQHERELQKARDEGKSTVGLELEQAETERAAEKLAQDEIGQEPVREAVKGSAVLRKPEWKITEPENVARQFLVPDESLIRQEVNRLWKLYADDEAQFLAVCGQRVPGVAVTVVTDVRRTGRG